MAVTIKMQGELEPYELDEDFGGIINAMNTSLQQSKAFIIVDMLDGRHMGIYIPNIVGIEEVAD